MKTILVRLFQRDQRPDAELSSCNVLERFGDSISHLEAISRADPRVESVLLDVSCPPSEMKDALLRWLTERGATIHLALDGRSASDWPEAFDSFRSLSPNRLLLAHVDQISDWASVWRGIGGSGLPCSYFSSGPRLRDPIEFIGAQQTPKAVQRAASA